MPTLAQLDALANAVPVLNKKAAAKASAAQSVAAQQQVQQAQLQPGVSATRAAQAAAPQAVAQQAHIQQAATEQTQQQLGQIANVGLATQATANETAAATQAREQQERLASQENAQKLQLSRADLGMRKKVTGAEQGAAQRLQKMGIEVDNKLQLATLRQREQLNRLGGDVRDKILDSRLQFERDEMGRKFSNERQLADYTVANAKTMVEFQDKMREAQQTQERKLQTLEFVEKKLRQTLTQEWQRDEQFKDNKSKERMIKAAAAMKEKIRKEQAKARANAQMWQAAGMIAGAAFVVATGGTGAAVLMGAGVGGGAGMLAGGAAGGAG